MQVWRALLLLLGLGAMVFTSVSVRLLATEALAESAQDSRARPVVLDECARCHSTNRGGS